VAVSPGAPVSRSDANLVRPRGVAGHERVRTR